MGYFSKENRKQQEEERYQKHGYLLAWAPDEHIKGLMQWRFGKRIAKLIGLAATIIMLVFLLVNKGLFLDDYTFYYGDIVFIFALLAAPLAGLLIASVPVYGTKIRPFAATVCFFIMPIFTMQMMECYNGNFVYNFSIPTFLLNYVTYLFFYLLVYLICRRYHMTVLIVNISIFVAGMINYFVDSFRGTPIVPMDIPTFRTGMEVADGYSYSLSWQLIMAAICMLLIYLFNKRFIPCIPIRKLKFKILTRVLIVGWLLICVITLFFTDFLANRGYKPDFWNQSRGYHNTGTWFNFCLNLKYIHPSKPDGYHADETDEILDAMLAEYGVIRDGKTSINMLTGENTYQAADGEHPHVIAIMNESLADLRTLGDLELNQENLKFIDSLTENTVKGTLEVPVFGAGTSNSEFEFMTGNSITFLPAGSNVYQSYIKAPIPSLLSTLTEQGYSNITFHPYYAAGWNRIAVYNYMGFSDFISIEDFIDQEIIDEYLDTNDAIQFERNLKERYPDRDMLLRRFVSDAYDYKMIEDMFEEREAGKPFFILNVTMQNHGGYSMSYPNFTEDVWATNLSKDYPKAKRYLSLVKDSDEAFQSLVEYFENVDEPTIICMFGDHQPSIEDEFYEELYDVSDLDELSDIQTQDRYSTPFIIWANYDIPEATIDRMSCNYLSTLLCQLAGVELTPYQKYLACLHEKLPVIDTVGYMDAEGNIYHYNKESEYADLINEYQCLEYNAVIDVDNRNEALFKIAQ